MIPTWKFKDDLPHVGVGQEPVVIPDWNLQRSLLQFRPFQANENEGSIPFWAETFLYWLGLFLVSGAKSDGGDGGDGTKSDGDDGDDGDVDDGGDGDVDDEDVF